ncbi:MAG: methylated-DNA--[protein]-cysteine S-methyltransferase [Parafilimonas sp.]
MDMITKHQQTQEYSFTDLRLINKISLKQRINNTKLKTDASFILNKWQTGDETLNMFYKVEHTIIGDVLIAATEKGITFLGFVNDNTEYILADVKKRFPENILIEQDAKMLNDAFDHINNASLKSPLLLHLKGTSFQYKIWEKLMLIPAGGLSTYGKLSGDNKDARAVGGAVGANPVSYFVPCHRVVRSDGSFNGYFWGNAVKEKLLMFEMSRAIAEKQ